jgi:hypothetical protein
VIRSRWMRWAGHVACMGDRRGAHGVLIGRPDVKRPLGRSRRRWEKIWKWMFNKWDVGIDWIALGWDRDR